MSKSYCKHCWENKHWIEVVEDSYTNKLTKYEKDKHYGSFDKGNFIEELRYVNEIDRCDCKCHGD